MTEGDLRPTPEVEGELREVLRRDESRLGDTFRGMEEGRTHREIADELGVTTHGFGYNNQATIEAILDGRRSDSPVPTRVTRSRVASLLRHASLSEPARTYLQRLWLSWIHSSCWRRLWTSCWGLSAALIPQQPSTGSASGMPCTA